MSTPWTPKLGDLVRCANGDFAGLWAVYPERKTLASGGICFPGEIYLTRIGADGTPKGWAELTITETEFRSEWRPVRPGDPDFASPPDIEREAVKSGTAKFGFNDRIVDTSGRFSGVWSVDVSEGCLASGERRHRSLPHPTGKGGRVLAESVPDPCGKDPSLPPEPAYWMVHGSGPARVRHASPQSAKDEALRLAAKAPGESFAVLQSIFSVCVPLAEPVVTPHAPSVDADDERPF